MTAKVSASKATEDVATAPVQYGQLLERDELNYNWSDRRYGLSGTSGWTVSREWFSVFVVRKGISGNGREKDIEGNYTHSDPVSISSVTRNLSSTVISNSPIYNTKKVQKRKAENEVSALISAYGNRPRAVAVSNISLARNPASPISLDGKSGTKSFEGRWFEIAYSY